MPHASAVTRQHYMDWLRISAVLLLIPFHTARLFDVWEPNYVKNAVLSPLLSYQNAFLWVWHMPLLFLLAGMASWHAMGLRGARGYLWERFSRLFIPLVFGVLVIVPPQAYLARFQVTGYSEGYGAFLRDYFIIRGDLTGYAGLFTPAHLWFILYLFVFCVAALPLFMFLKRNPSVIQALARWCSRPGMLFLAAIPLGIAGALPGISGKNPFYYCTLFVYGYLLAGDLRFVDIIDRNKRMAAILGILAMSASLFFWLSRYSFPEKSVPDILFYTLRTFNTWFWLILLLGYGRRWLNARGAWKPYLNEAAYPFYILHQTVIMAIGFYVVRWNQGVFVKYVFVMAASLAVTLLLYEICIRRWSVMRFLFGMKPGARNITI